MMSLCVAHWQKHSLRWSLTHASVPAAGQTSQKKEGQKATYPLAAAVYIAHWAFLAAFALLFVHVQVATRLLSICPPLYWFTAQLCRKPRYARLIWTYFLVYGVLGCILFPQFYPWT